MNNHLLSTALGAAVPLHIFELEAKGGPDDADLADCARLSQFIGEKGDVILFRGKQPGESAAAFNALARGIAILSFCPGGVRCFGSHWQSGERNRGSQNVQQAPA